MTGPRIDRLSREDMTLLAAEASGARMQFAAIAVLDGAPSVGEVRALLASRIDAVPRLRQRLDRVPPGRPFWVPDAGFDLGGHVVPMTCAAPGDRQALLVTAARVVEDRLTLARAPWRIVLIDGLADGRSALVIVLHHVVADGLAGLAILSRLVDRAADPRPAGPTTAAPAGTTPPPPDAALLPPSGLPRADRSVRRRAALRRWSGLPARLGAAATELLRGGIRGAPACSLNAGPVGPGRALGTAQTALAPLVVAARSAGGTVNDVALTAVTGGLRDLLADRGERLDRLVVSIPITSRRRAEVTELGNRVGVLPVSLPLAGSPRQRLPVVAGITRGRKTDSPGASAALYGPLAQGLAGLGAFGWFIGHQRLVNTFLSNVRGPAEPLRFGGRRIVELIPVSPISGNVSVGFVVLSYAGRMTVTVVADADRCPDVDRLADLVQAQLDDITDRADAGPRP